MSFCLSDIISPQNKAAGTVHSPNPEIGVLWTEIEPNLRGVSLFSFILPNVLCFHAKRFHFPLRGTPWWLVQSRFSFSTLDKPRNEADRPLRLISIPFSIQKLSEIGALGAGSSFYLTCRYLHNQRYSIFALFKVAFFGEIGMFLCMFTEKTFKPSYE